MEKKAFVLDAEETEALVELRMKNLCFWPPRTLEKDLYVFDRIEEEAGLDEIHIETKANFLLLPQGCAPEEALQEYAQIRTAILALFSSIHTGSDSFFQLPVNVEGIEWKSMIDLNSISFLRVTEKTEIPEEKKESLRRLCEDNKIRIVEQVDAETLRDLLFDCHYGFLVTTYPGSADDAATYGEVTLFGMPDKL